MSLVLQAGVPVVFGFAGGLTCCLWVCKWANLLSLVLQVLQVGVPAVFGFASGRTCCLLFCRCCRWVYLLLLVVHVGVRVDFGFAGGSKCGVGFCVWVFLFVVVCLVLCRSEERRVG